MLTNASNKKAVLPVALQPVQMTPVVSLFLPFEPKMTAKNKLTYKLQTLLHGAETKLQKSYPVNIAEPVIQQLKTAVNNLDYSTHKKSIAIYASADAEKVLYLDFPLEEKILINPSFDIRSLVELKQNLQHYILLVLSTRVCKVYFGNGEQLVAMLTNTCKKTTIAKGGKPADNETNDNASINNFLEQTDNNLAIILNYFPLLPLFVMGEDSMLNKYEKITRNQLHITQLIKADHDELVADEIKASLHTYLQNWENTRTKHLRHQLSNALNNNKIATGIDNVIKAANNKRTKLLVVERNFTFPIIASDNKTANPLSQNSLFNDAADEVIERVLTVGGDVEFVDKDVLQDYQHIALIFY